MTRFRDSSRRPPRDGFSLLELAIAVALGTTLLAVLGRVLVNTTGSIDYIVKDLVTVQDIKDTVSGIGDELRRSSAATITVTTGSLSDTLTLRVSSGTGASSTYGAEDQSGTFQTGWSIRYRAVGTDLVRDVLNTGGTVVSSGIVAQHVSNQVGTKALSVVQNGPLYTVNLQIFKSFDDGKTYSKGMQTTVFVKN